MVCYVGFFLQLEVIGGLGSRSIQVWLHLQEGLWGSGKRLLQIGLKRLSGIDRTRCVILAGIAHGSWDLYSMINRLFNPSITLDFLIGHAFCDYPLLSNAPRVRFCPMTVGDTRSPHGVRGRFLNASL